MHDPGQSLVKSHLILEIHIILIALGHIVINSTN